MSHLDVVPRSRLAAIEKELSEAESALIAAQCSARETIDKVAGALFLLYADTREYQQLNHLGGHDNLSMVRAREALKHVGWSDEP